MMATRPELGPDAGPDAGRAAGTDPGTDPRTAAKHDARLVLDGVRALEERRGDEDVKFRQVADHLVDFVARHPETRGTIDALGSYLAGVEATPHDHDAPAGSEGG